MTYVYGWRSVGEGFFALLLFILLLLFHLSVTKNQYLFVFFAGFGENCRVLKWVFDRVDGKQDVEKSTVGYLPKNDALDLSGLAAIDMKELMSVPTDYWLEQLDDIEKYYNEQFGEDIPKQLWDEVHAFRERLTSTQTAA